MFIPHDAAPRCIVTAWALVALAATGCGGGSDTTGEVPRAAAVRFLDEVRAGRLEAAWQGTSTEFKSLMGVENLRDYVKTHPALKAQAEFDESRAVDSGGRAMAECVFHATAKVRGKAIPAKITVLVAPEAGGQVERVVVE